MQLSLFNAAPKKKSWDSWEIVLCAKCNSNVRVDGAMKGPDGRFFHQLCPPEKAA
jgi:hypothetical protein